MLRFPQGGAKPTHSVIHPFPPRARFPGRRLFERFLVFTFFANMACRAVTRHSVGPAVATFFSLPPPSSLPGLSRPDALAIRGSGSAGRITCGRTFAEAETGSLLGGCAEDFRYAVPPPPPPPSRSFLLNFLSLLVAFFFLLLLLLVFWFCISTCHSPNHSARRRRNAKRPASRDSFCTFLHSYIACFPTPTVIRLHCSLLLRGSRVFTLGWGNGGWGLCIHSTVLASATRHV